ncbi:ATP-binding protein [Arundinibacter roseus]|uniref:ATP-binding protein n=1 Tax=Arundinibacter roseus TaxID=2070510 RepID=A0A4R4KAB3_9BACT|nr:ATP-binding protein [Arundinibacter roseus]TDB64533.1 ATP-binding protein [Arundinibacter roseus]
MIDFSKTTLEIIQMGEGLTVEFKRTIDSPFKIAKTLASFANTSGGILLVGVNDSRETVGIVSELRELQKLEQACESLIEMELRIRCKSVSFGSKKILRIEVDESQDKPHYAINEKGDRIIYVRIKDKSVPTNRLMLPGEGDAVTEKLLLSKPVKILLQYLKRNDALTDKELSNMINVSEKRAMRLLHELESKGVVLRRGSGKTALYSLKLVN